MTETRQPLKVFLCHAHADRDAVRGLYIRLTQDGVDAWLDKEKLLPGQDWELEIKKAVREADVVVVCLSKQFNQAGFRQKEVRLALDTAMEKPEGEIFIIPARLEECDSLESLRRWHWVDLFEENGYEMLTRALRTRADHIGATLQLKQSSLLNDVSALKNDKPVVMKQENKNNSRRRAFLRKPNTAILVAMIGLIGIIGAAVISSSWFENLFAKPTETATASAMPIETATQLSGPIENENLADEITDPRGVTMRLVPAGDFIMGSNADAAFAQCQKTHTDCQQEMFLNEEPIHSVYLDAFYMDKYEVTNTLYMACVETGNCIAPQDVGSNTRASYYGNSEFGDFPVINVNWNQAAAYCAWRGPLDGTSAPKLPTEAQWEKAARGVDGRTYPWGEEIDCSKANYWDGEAGCAADTTKVGIYGKGVSPYGIYDLAGNVWEWTADRYSDVYYQNSPSSNPQGADVGQLRVLRGGSWYNFDYYLRTTLRFTAEPDSVLSNLGFRCVRDVPPLP